VLPLFVKNRKQELELNDLYKPLDDHRAESLGDQLTKAWEEQLKKEAETKKPPSLVRAITNVFWLEIVKLGFVLLSIEGLLK
jgi:ATP-binding cassette subfamily C (CFTR/MRP) protein 4